MTAVATNAAALDAAIAAYQNVLASDPANPDAQSALANHYILKATAYTRSVRAKRRLFREAMARCELAMYNNPGFRKRADAGAKPWEACSELGEREMNAMLFWITAMLYEFKECMSLPSKVANVEWIRRARPMLERMEAIEEGWGGGVIPFTWSFYYHILPRKMGGDRAMAWVKLEQAVRLGPDRLLSRWGRARYFHRVAGDHAGFVADLEWVAAQDPARMVDEPHWKAFIQRDAREQLRDADRHF